MNNYVFYGAARGGGKTTQMLRWVDEALSRAERVAVVVPHSPMEKQIQERFLNSDVEFHIVSENKSLYGREIPYADLYAEATFPHARGMIYDHVYVDNAELFREDPTRLVSLIAPGVPATFTYTPYPFE